MVACPTCGKELTYIAQYDRYYCYAEERYAPKGFGGWTTAAPSEPGGASSESHAGHYHCPSCGKELTFIEQYNRYYCYPESKYAPRDVQPVGATPAQQPVAATEPAATPSIEPVVAAEPAVERPAAVEPAPAVATPQPIATEPAPQEAVPSESSPAEAAAITPELGPTPQVVEPVAAEPAKDVASVPGKKAKPKGPRLTRAAVMKAKKPKLMEWAAAYRVPTSGTRTDLIDRLLAFMKESKMDASDFTIREAVFPSAATEPAPAAEAPQEAPQPEPVQEPLPTVEPQPEELIPEPRAEPPPETQPPSAAPPEIAPVETPPAEVTLVEPPREPVAEPLPATFPAPAEPAPESAPVTSFIFPPEEAPKKFHREEVLNAKRTQLLTWCKEFGLSTRGGRQMLQDRVLIYLEQKKLFDLEPEEEGGPRVPAAEPAPMPIPLELPPERSAEPQPAPVPEQIPPQPEPEPIAREPEHEPRPEPRAEPTPVEPEAEPEPEEAEPEETEELPAETSEPAEAAPWGLPDWMEPEREPPRESWEPERPLVEPEPEPERTRVEEKIAREPEPVAEAPREMRPAVQPTPARAPTRAPAPEVELKIEKALPCPSCGKELTYIAQYDRLYCYAEGKYAPKGYGAAVSVVGPPPPVETAPKPAPLIVTPPPRVAPAPAPKPRNACPTCGRELRFIREYDRWWCEAERKYAPKEFGKPRNACPTCGKDLTWIPDYQRWYCYAEAKYAPRTMAAPTAAVSLARPALAAAAPTVRVQPSVAARPAQQAVVSGIARAEHRHGRPIAGIGLTAVGFSLFIVYILLSPLSPLIAMGVFDPTTLGAQVLQVVGLLGLIGLVLAGIGVVVGLASVRSR